MDGRVFVTRQPKRVDPATRIVLQYIAERRCISRSSAATDLPTCGESRNRSAVNYLRENFRTIDPFLICVRIPREVFVCVECTQFSGGHLARDTAALRLPTAVMHLSIDLLCPSCASRISSDTRACPHCGSAGRGWQSASTNRLVLPGSVHLSDDLTPYSTRDRRIIAIASVVGLVACFALVGSRNTADVDPTRVVASVPVRPILTEEVGLGLFRMSATPNSARPFRAAPMDVAPQNEIKSTAPVDSTVIRLSGVRSADASVSAPPPNAQTAGSFVVAESAAERSTSARVALRTESDSPDEVAAIAAVPNVLSSPALRLTAQLSAAPPLSHDPLALVPAGERLDADEVRTSVSEFVSKLRARTTTSSDLMAFYAHGSAHHVALAGDPSTASASAASVRVTFDVRLSKYDAIGRQQSRILPVTMIVAKRDGDVRASAVTLGELRRP